MMKKFIILIIGIACILVQVVFAQFHGPLRRDIFISQSHTSHEVIHYFADQALYMQGGVVFVYPDGLFTTTPCVTIGFEHASLALTPTILLSAYLDYNNTASALVIVSRSNSSQPEEVEDGQVLIHFYALGE